MSSATSAAWLTSLRRPSPTITLGEPEKAALINAEVKLGALGPTLAYPHSSAVQGADRLRELRPRGGRSRWRALYRQVGDEFVIGAIAPEAQVDPRRFTAACRHAEARLAELEDKA